MTQVTSTFNAPRHPVPSVFEIDDSKLRAICDENTDLGVKVFRFLAVTMSQRLTAAREQLRSRVRPGLISHG